MPVCVFIKVHPWREKVLEDTEMKWRSEKSSSIRACQDSWARVFFLHHDVLISSLTIFTCSLTLYISSCEHTMCGKHVFRQWCYALDKNIAESQAKKELFFINFKIFFAFFNQGMQTSKVLWRESLPWTAHLTDEFAYKPCCFSTNLLSCSSSTRKESSKKKNNLEG